MALSLSTMQTNLVAALLFLIIWAVGVGVYRLYLSPLANFPGDKLAALSGWVETYHDVFRGGQFIFKLEEWHAKYGPVVRISPWEVHVADPAFGDVLFASNSQFDKKIEWKYRFGIPHSTFDTIEHHHHRARRAALAPFFSKQKIAGIADFIAAKAHRLCDRLEGEFGGTGRPATLNNCFTAFTFDVVTFYAFARSFEYMEHPTFEGPFTNAAKALATTLHTMGHFPWLLALLQALPKQLAAALDPNMAAVFAFHGEIEDQIRAIKSGANDSYKDVAHKTIFNELLSSDLPPEEKAVERLKHEGGSVVAGGVETTATALAKATFFILETPRIRARLAAELAAACPDARQTPALAALEALPYLGAVVSETLRLTIGISQRTIRTSRHAPVVLPDGRPIPAGAYFSATTYLTHTNPDLWGAGAREFQPERWLSDAEGGGGGGDGIPSVAAPAKHLLPFGRGPRMCVGMNLARAELFIGLAVLFRRCDLTLFETTRADIDMHADYFIPLPDPKSQGVRVLVR